MFAPPPFGLDSSVGFAARAPPSLPRAGAPVAPPLVGRGFGGAGSPSDAMRQQAAAQLLQHAANLSDDPAAAVARMTPTAVPRLDVGIASQMPQAGALLPSHVGPGPEEVRLGTSCEAEIDRLVKERLCGRSTDRTSLGRHLKRDKSDFYYTPLGRLEEAARGAGQALKNGVSWGSSVLLGRLHTLPGPRTACNCKRVQQSMPVYIFEDDGPAEDSAAPEPPAPAPAPSPPVTNSHEDGFADLIGSSPATGEDPGRSELAFPPDAEERGKSRDEADEGEEGADGLAPLPNLPGTKKKKQRRPGDTSSALSVSSSMTSSAASLLGGVLANQAGGLGTSSTSSRSKPAKTSADAQSSIGAGLEPAFPANDTAPPEPAPRVPQTGAKGSKSVIAGGISTSSKSGALLAGMVAQQDGKSTIGGGGGRKGGSKSVIAGMSGNTSSSAQLLAGLAQQPKSGGGSAAAAGEEVGTEQKEMKSTIAPGTKGGGGSSRPKPKGDSKTVISGMQSNSNAASLLSGLVQQQGQSKKKQSSTASAI